MKALTYHGPGRRSWEDKPRPTIQEPTDAVVRIEKTTICGTDLHILKGDVPAVTDGRILGHEGVGVVEETGTAVSSFKKGDRVLISCITSCGKCDACKKGMYSHCADGGWILGHLIDGTQAEYVRIPHADNSLHHVPKGSDEDALVMLSDILTAQFYSPAELIMIDLDDNRLEVAKKLGATRCLNSGDGKAVEQVMALTGGKGVDVAIEAVGFPATFDVCQDIVAAGGHLANVGVHGKPVSLKLEKLWIQNVTITTGLVDTNTTPMLLKTVVAGRLQPRQLITHAFKLDDFMKAYDTFANAAKEKALKVIIRRG
jgi:alcohol dehydrogenase